MPTSVQSTVGPAQTIQPRARELMQTLIESGFLVPDNSSPLHGVLRNEATAKKDDPGLVVEVHADVDPGGLRNHRVHVFAVGEQAWSSIAVRVTGISSQSLAKVITAASESADQETLVSHLRQLGVRVVIEDLKQAAEESYKKANSAAGLFAVNDDLFRGQRALGRQQLAAWLRENGCGLLENDDFVSALKFTRDKERVAEALKVLAAAHNESAPWENLWRYMEDVSAHRPIEPAFSQALIDALVNDFTPGAYGLTKCARISAQGLSLVPQPDCIEQANKLALGLMSTGKNALFIEKEQPVSAHSRSLLAFLNGLNFEVFERILEILPKSGEQLALKYIKSFSPTSHDAIAHRLIDSGLTQAVAGELRSFCSLSIGTGLELIGRGFGRAVIDNIRSFALDEFEFGKIVDAAIGRGHINAVIVNLDQVPGFALRGVAPQWHLREFKDRVGLPGVALFSQYWQLMQAGDHDAVRAFCEDVSKTARELCAEPQCGFNPDDIFEAAEIRQGASSKPYAEDIRQALRTRARVEKRIKEE